MQYHHTQTSPMHYILYAAAGMFLMVAWCVPDLTLTFSIVAVVVFVVAFSMKTLTVADAGDRLSVRFGPLPFFRKTIAYADITAVEPNRTRFIDGWGVHYTPGRGWTYNLWGYDCVKLTLGRRMIHIGTDDVDGLVAFLRTKIHAPCKHGG